MKQNRLPGFETKIETNPQKAEICLGIKFSDSDARRAYFTEELRKRLQDPEFRKIEGFPKGEDDDILKLSDPPYYTACPNPWIAEFIAEWESQKPRLENGDYYHREPFAADVSEGKNDPIYRIPAYHTKVPPKAIEKYILHYSSPGDIILDGFAGSGMLGVACTHPRYKSNDRHAILIDLSPFATFMGSIMCSPLPSPMLDDSLSKWLIQNISPMYQSKSRGPLREFEYAVWSYWGRCHECGEKFRLYDLIVDYKKGRMLDKYRCPACDAEITSRKQEKYFETEFDTFLNIPHAKAKDSIVFISEKDGVNSARRDASDWDNELFRGSVMQNADYIPTEIPYMHMTHERNNLPRYWGISHINHFYTNRNYSALAKLCSMSDLSMKKSALFCATRALYRNFTKRNRFHVYKYSPKGSPIGPLSNTLYVPNIHVESNVSIKCREVIDSIKKQSSQWANKRAVVSTQSISQASQIPSDSIDFIFTDPPFGGNINYSEQNYLIEWWLKVFTNNKPEAITNSVQNKGIGEYQSIMTLCFKEYYRVLKSGRWMVVEFHNSSNVIWVAIQQALESSGFVVATVSILDKVHSTLHQDHKAAAVDKDLAITVYKPNGGLEKRFEMTAGSPEGAWDFVRTHLVQLPVFLSKDGEAQVIPERQNFLLFDRMVAFHVQRGVTVPLSSAEFYAGISQRYSERDGMYFTPEQVAEYDRKRMTVKTVIQLQLFVTDESSAIQWLKQQLTKKTQTFQEIHPHFMKEIAGWQKHEKPLELSVLLEQNFLRYDGNNSVPEQIHAYLSSNWKELRNLSKDDPALVAKARERWYVPDPNKAGDLEKLRERALLKEFEEYKQAKKKLKVFRLEAVRAGFKKAWQDRDYSIIVAVADKIPNSVLEEDLKLLMWYDQAVTRMGGE